MYFSLCPLTLVLSQGATEKGLAVFIPSHQAFIHIDHPSFLS